MMLDYLKQGIQGLNTGGYKELTVVAAGHTTIIRRGAHLANNDEILIMPWEGKIRSVIVVRSIDSIVYIRIG